VAHILCLDFDGTVVPCDTTSEVLARFAGGDMERLREMRARGEMTVEQFNAAALRTVEATREELSAFVAALASAREGFAGAVDRARWTGWAPMVVSTAFDFAVAAVLDGQGLDRLARHTGRTSREYRWRVRYLSPRGVDLEDGFVLSYLAALRAAGDTVVYVGCDGETAGAAKLAELVIAGGELYERLDGVHGRLHRFEGFEDAWRTIEREFVTQG
jgi:2-hydroxy-3-keto-5-methylthiopentenyl-1-phosphate phosphatase